MSKALPPLQGDDAPSRLPFVASPVPFPEPLATWVNRSYHSDGCSSAVTRLWPMGTGYCGLCPRERCNAYMDVCVVGVEQYLTDDEAEVLSTLDRPWIAPLADLPGRTAGGTRLVVIGDDKIPDPAQP